MIVSLKSVCKSYRTDGVPVTALDHVDLDIGEGELSTLAGPSGSGKSTLLHLVGALDQPTEGKVFIRGTDLSTLDKNRLAEFRLRKVGFVFQAYNLIPVLTARENVEYPLLLQGVGKREREERALSFLDRVGLSGEVQKRPGEMSGGQQQRVAVARALASKPEIILADEPTANLDSVTGASLIDLFRELNEQYRITFLFASHDPMVIRRAHRIIRLKDGKIEKEERP